MRRHTITSAVLLTTLGMLAAIVVSGCSSAVESSAPTARSVPARSVPARAGATALTAPGLAASMDAAPARHAEPGSLPSLDEEVWVIVRPDGDEAAEPADDVPGTGSLVGRRSGSGRSTEVPMPLRHTEVDTAISAFVASVTVNQQFHNPYDEKIEALYVFPLPQNAAVNGFIMKVGERRIRGIIRERREAEQIYADAKRQGYAAALLTQERPNIFTQAVANIEPGNDVDIEITYFHTLTYDDGWYEYVFPMVVGPRFNPPGSADGVGAVSRGTYGGSGQATEVQYLRPEERSGHDIDLTVALDAGVTVEEVVCRSHEIEVGGPGSERMQVTLRADDRIPNKDFVLRYRIAGESVKSSLLTHRDDTGGYFAYMLYPPLEFDDLDRRPMEMVFVLDCSGSMRGQPMAIARAAVDHALSTLTPDDTFQIIRFSNDSSRLGVAPIAATPKNIRRGRAYLKSLDGRGGTMMIKGIRAALDFPHDPDRLRFVTFLTDGYIGNEREILGAVHDRIGSSRIFSFGVGASPNRYLMNRMAKVGRGAVAYLGLNDDGAAVMDRFFARASRAVLTDITVDWDGADVVDVLPERIPDLFVGRPVILTGRFEGEMPAEIRVRGRSAGQPVEATFDVTGDATGDHAALASVWARNAIAGITDRSSWDPDPELPERILGLALEYGLMSAYTSFVAVDSRTMTAGDHGTTVQVAVPVPDGVRYDTTVTE